MEIRVLKEGEESSIRELFKLAFGLQFYEDEWDWKYRLAPWGSASTVAIHDGMIIAHYGGLRLLFREGRTEYMAYQICDVMTHPDYRAMFLARRGAMVRAAELYESSIPMDFAFGFPSERHARLATIQLGVERNRHVKMLVKPLSEIQRKKNPLLKVKHGWANIKAQEIDRLWNKIKYDFSLTIDKTSDYNFWRYRDRPRRSYDVLTFRNRLTNSLKGWAVISIAEKDLHVLDFFTATNDDLENFFGEIERIAKMRDAQRVKLWVNPSEEIFPLFKSLDYIEEQGIPLTCKILKKRLPLKPEAFFQKFCYRMGDYDAS
jgi:Acetyltransferase (GNAT) domain